jgi:DNA-binding transcriptional regulator YdaS (Cro superfamily)
MADRARGLRKAVAAMGNKRRLALALRVSEQAVGQWDWVPAKRVLDVERVSGVPREVLRPDLYRGQEFRARMAAAAAGT